MLEFCRAWAGSTSSQGCVLARPELRHAVISYIWNWILEVFPEKNCEIFCGFKIIVYFCTRKHNSITKTIVEKMHRMTTETVICRAVLRRSWNVVCESKGKTVTCRVLWHIATIVELCDRVISKRKCSVYTYGVCSCTCHSTLVPLWNQGYTTFFICD